MSARSPSLRDRLDLLAADFAHAVLRAIREASLKEVVIALFGSSAGKDPERWLRREFEASVKRNATSHSASSRRSPQSQSRRPPVHAPESAPRFDLAAIRRRTMLEALQVTSGDRSHAAVLLGIGRSTLHYWIASLDPVTRTSIPRAPKRSADGATPENRRSQVNALKRAYGSRFDLAEVERRTTKAALRTADGNRSHAARLLGVSRSTASAKIARVTMAQSDPRPARSPHAPDKVPAPTNTVRAGDGVDADPYPGSAIDDPAAVQGEEAGLGGSRSST